MKISTIEGNIQRLDGGAMFGNVPKALWTRWIEADSLNRIKLACRGLLVETENRKILFETGIGTFMSPDMKKRFGIDTERHILLDSLKKLDVSQADITDIVLSHMHFDHAGGLLEGYDEQKKPGLLFPQATFHIGEETFGRSVSPHQRDRASFIPELNTLLIESGRLHLIKEQDHLNLNDVRVDFFSSNGHTPGMLLPIISFQGKKIFFTGDLIPGTPWVHLPITMGYDRYPELLIDEKTSFLNQVIEEDAWIFYTHDFHTCISKVTFDKTKKKYITDSVIQSFTRITPQDLKTVKKETP